MLESCSPCNGKDLDSAPTVTSIITTILDAPPSCIEFSPLAPDLLVVGTYELDTTLLEPILEDDTQVQQRSGSLVLFQLKDDRLHLLCTISTYSAVLDLHFSPFLQHVFAVATSTGAIEFYQLSLERAPNIVLLKRLQVTSDPTVLVLSLAWHNSATQVKPTTLAVSLSDGRVSIVDYYRDQMSVQSLRAHSLEVWTVLWSCKTNNIWSGGDDSKLCLSSANFAAEGNHVFGEPLMLSKIEFGGPKLAPDVAERLRDRRSDSSIANTCTIMDVVRSDTKLHSAGVTAILPIQLVNDEGTEILFTGSYDEYMRVIKPHQGNRWTVLGELHLGGGVWRLKMMSATTHDACRSGWRILASCMHAGSRVVNIVCHHSSVPHEDDHWSFEILAKFEEHESMNYASDSSNSGEFNQGGKNGVTVASTSFYDRRLCIWSIPGTHNP